MNVVDVDIFVEEQNISSDSVNKVNDIAVQEINNITSNSIIDMTILCFILPCISKRCVATDTLVLEELWSKTKGVETYHSLKRACGYGRHVYTSKLLKQMGVE